ncbi:outer membrane protein assembly factor BamB [Castellaniella sp.]|uniref:outer membrane protein assembly factor BamB n=1 Tax=Castellaniella sp. TaxID=1955812 RepID=UPI00355D64FF
MYARIRFFRLIAIGLLSGSLAACGLFAESDPRFDPAPLTEYAPSLAVAPRWSVSVGSGGGYGFIPQLAADTVHVATPSGAVAALDQASGAVRWQIRTEPLSAGAGSDGRVTAVVTRSGEVLALDQQGGELWRAQAASAVNIPPVVGNGIVAVRTSDYRIQAFDISSGKLRWEVQRPGPALALRTSMRMRMLPDLLLAGLPNGRLILIDTPTGAVRWEASVSAARGASDLERIADVVGEPIVVGPRVCGTSYQGRTTCFDISQGGRAVWTQDVGSATGMATDEQRLYLPDDRDRVRALGLSDGAAAWVQTALLNRQLSEPAVAGPAVAVGDFEGYVHFLSRADGALMARLRIGGGPITSALVPVSGGVLVQTGDGRVVRVAAGG